MKTSIVHLAWPPLILCFYSERVHFPHSHSPSLAVFVCVGVLRLCVCVCFFVSVRVSRQDVLNAVGVFQLPAMALMFPEREGMRVDPDSRPPPDGQKVRKRDTPHVDACPESSPCRVVSFLSFAPWGGCSARDFLKNRVDFLP